MIRLRLKSEFKRESTLCPRKGRCQSPRTRLTHLNRTACRCLSWQAEKTAAPARNSQSRSARRVRTKPEIGGNARAIDINTSPCKIGVWGIETAFAGAAIVSTGNEPNEPPPERRSVNCKDYHQPKATAPGGSRRSAYQKKSRCPAWAIDANLQQALMDSALVDSTNAKDAFGRPKRLWNAVENYIFVAVSCNLESPVYNCYPEWPPDGKLVVELQRRAERTRDEVLNRWEVGDE